MNIRILAAGAVALAVVAGGLWLVGHRFAATLHALGPAGAPVPARLAPAAPEQDAGEFFSGEDPALRPPRAAVLTALPAISNSDPDRDCTPQGKLAQTLANGRELWFLSSPCGASGGHPLWLVLAEKGKAARVVLETGAEAGLVVRRHAQHNEMPDIEVLGGGNADGLHQVGYTFDGQTYRDTYGHWQQTFAQLASNDVPAAQRSALGNANGSDCELTRGDAQKLLALPAVAGTQGQLVVAKCGDTGTVWVVQTTGATSRVLLEDSVKLAGDDNIYGDVDILQAAPDQPADLCFVRPVSGTGCWTFNGRHYVPGKNRPLLRMSK